QETFSSFRALVGGCPERFSVNEGNRCIELCHTRRQIELVSEEITVTFGDEGLNLTARMAELNATITFINGKALRAAAYKGPKGRERLLTTVAAILARDREGITKPTAPSGSNPESAVSTEFINDAQRVLERAIVAVLPSRSTLARDLLLDLAISSRCEALPRLSAELRRLSSRCQQAVERSAEFEPATLLFDAARSYALLEALRTSPPDAALTGSLRRHYQTKGPMQAWPLAVSRWRTATGARGLTTYALNPETNHWHSVLEGRSAGIDTAFTPSGGYEMAMWGVGSPRVLMGRRVRLPAPSLSEDGALASRTNVANELLNAPLTPADITRSSARHQNWRSLRGDLVSRIGTGLRRRAVPLPALISPSKFGRLGFDEMNQCYKWEVIDDEGDGLVLSLPQDNEESALRLWKLGNTIDALVVEARLGERELLIRPVSALFQHRGGLTVHNIDFDRWPLEKGFKKRLSKITESFAKPLALPTASTDALERIITEAGDELVNALSGELDSKLGSVRRRAEACGLTALCQALEDVSKRGDTRSVLKASYIAGELSALYRS
ncbi:MAG: hypothetical protein AAF493_05335, partial [Pseudomonadota bacterium]